MRKLRVLSMALVACLAVGSVGVAVAQSEKGKPKKVKVKTKVNVGYTPGKPPTTYDPYQPYNPYDPDGTNAVISGKVKAKKGCARRRSVTVSRLGQTSSTRDGQFSFTIQGNSATPGNYRVRVKGKKFTKGGGQRKKKIKCKPTTKTLVLANLSG